MKTDLQISHLTVTPGQTVQVDIGVTNTDDVIDGITALVDGINPNWVRLERPLVSVFPDASDTIGLVFDIPRTCPAGDYLVVVHIVSTLDADRESVQDFWLTVTEVVDLDVELTPSIVTGGKDARFTAAIRNRSNVAAAVTVNAWEPTRAIDCRVDPQSIVLPFGEEAAVDVRLRGKRPWFGQPVPYSIIVTAQVDEMVVERGATFNQKPRIPRGLITAVILALIVLLWAFIFYWVISEIRGNEEATKALATDFLEGGADNIPLAAIAGSADGRITAVTSGEGVARMTVEANRVTADGELQPVGSVASGDDGSYVLPALVPGSYKLRFSGDGYRDVWYPGTPSEDEALVIPIVPAAVATDEELARSTGLDIQIGGEAGRLVGEIALPADSPDAPLTVTATLVPEQAPAATGADAVQVTEPGASSDGGASDGGASDGGASGDGASDGGTSDGSAASDGAASGDDPSLVQFTQTTTDGRIDLEGLPTPGTYEIRISGPGFETEKFEQRLGGGDAVVLNTVQISAATGSISGFVQSQSGNRLGGVLVTARAGETTIVTTTPTAGNTGAFEFVGLETPQTYILTFELDGFSQESLALGLEPGQRREGLSATLVGGDGTIVGSVTSPNGTAVGGAEVVVSGGDVSAETATLTSGGAGSFILSELPVPRRYALTVCAEGYRCETVDSTLLAAGTRDVGNITLVPLTAEVRGVVTVGGRASGDVTVTLNDGTLERTTTSATNPAGLYAFSGIPEGSYTLTFEGPDLTTRVLLVRVEPGIDVTQSASLQRSST